MSGNINLSTEEFQQLANGQGQDDNFYVPMDSERVRYRSYHRKQDIAILKQYWPTNSETYEPSTIYVGEVPANVRKKFNKAVRRHLPYWKELIDEVKKAGVSAAAAAAAAENTKDDPDIVAAYKSIAYEIAEKGKSSIRTLIPKVENGTKMVVDVTEKIRQQREWLNQDTFGITYFFILDASMTYKINEINDYVGCIDDCNTMLSLFPPLSDEEPVPHPHEVMSLLTRTQANFQLKDYEAALKDARCCCAAVRLLYHRYNKKESGQPEKLSFAMKLLKEYVDNINIISFILKMAVHAKVEKELQDHELPITQMRPFFSVDEINALEKELGVGIYGLHTYICHTCKKAVDETKLQLCPGCNRYWICGEECHLAGWHEHKKVCKSKWRKEKMHMRDFHSHRDGLMNAPPGSVDHVELLSIAANYPAKIEIAFPMIDKEAGEMFDAWTDRIFEEDEDDN